MTHEIKNIYFHIMWRFISLLWSIAFPLNSTAICVWKHWNTNYMYAQHCIRFIHVFMFINVNLFEISVGINSRSRGDFTVKMSLNVNLMLLAFIPTKKTRFHRLHELYFRWTHTPKKFSTKIDNLKQNERTVHCSIWILCWSVLSQNCFRVHETKRNFWQFWNLNLIKNRL